MDKIYNNKEVEEKIYKDWEAKGYFKPQGRFGNQQKYSIILPLPNANAPLHFGHAMFVIEDILTRYHRMQGAKTEWLPGADHAGFETQFVFEKKLQTEGKFRFDFDRETLYQMIWDFVQSNRPIMESQLRRLGFSLDWEKSKFPLEKDIVKIVCETFKNLFDDGLVYRAKRLVNYCTFDGTSFSDLEVIYAEKPAKLWFIRYPLADGGSITVATTRPETMLGDTAVVVNPKDKRYQGLVGKSIKLPLTGREIKIIADESVDLEFGTGAVKVTPAHDPNDYELGQKHQLEQISVIGFDGKMTKETGEFAGLYGKQARIKVVEKLSELGLLEKEENITHQVPVCYKCKNPIEPLLMDQWFVKMQPLAEPAIEAVKKKAIRIYPQSFEKLYLQFLENIRDWNISRQIVWGIQIPAWFRSWKPDKNIQEVGFHERTVEQVLNNKTRTYRLRDYGLKEGDKIALVNSQAEKVFGYGTIQKIAIKKVKEIDLKDAKHGAKYEKVEELIEAFKFHHPQQEVSEETEVWIYDYSFGVLKEGIVDEVFAGEGKPKGEGWKQDRDVFDTWFSSGQWPYATLKTTDSLEFYPTTVMETGYDILRWWVARMVMLGIYIQKKNGVEELAKQIPFQNIVLHGLVNDPLGKKMSKSKGNVVNPMEIVDQYGADAIRFALVYGTALGNDQALSYPKLEAMRKFSNKLWNMARFIEMQNEKFSPEELKDIYLGHIKLTDIHVDDQKFLKNKIDFEKKITKYLDNYEFNYAAQDLYEYTWHRFADEYIESVKLRVDVNSLKSIREGFKSILKLLHPFMPFITEEIYTRLYGGTGNLIISQWPK
ncbi:MAG: valine--tRNA ligase [Candidatus Levyibacteriota bacterium]|jgi:valyl-tRNA synthetase